jgi:hypothetical protein
MRDIYLKYEVDPIRNNEVTVKKYVNENSKFKGR